MGLQEKALFSEAARSDATTPGRRLRAVDLARNCLLAPFLEVSPEEQETMYTEMWLPWECRFSSLENLDVAFAEFVDCRLNNPDLESSEHQQKLRALSLYANQNGVNMDAISLYAKLVAAFTLLSRKLGAVAAARSILTDLLHMVNSEIVD